MIIRLNWKEFVQAGCERLKQLNPDLEFNEPAFRTDHGPLNGMKYIRESIHPSDPRFAQAMEIFA